MTDAPDKPETALRRELALVFGASLVLTIGLSLVQSSVAVLAPYVYILVAATFVILPTMVVQRIRREDAIEAGMRFGPLGRGLLWGGAATVITLIPFVIGNHVWNIHGLGLSADPGVAHFYQWDESTRGRPAGVDQAGKSGLFVWSEGRDLRVWWRDASEDKIQARLESSADMEVRPSAGVTFLERGPRVVVIEASGELRGLDARVEAGPAELELTFLRNGEPLTGERIEIGGGTTTEASDATFSVERSLAWVFGLLLLQIMFVGLPEEYFYRGYIQPTLERVLPGRIGPFGGLSYAVILGSVLFALGHVLVDLQPLRLAVFFPSLVFGWLRERSGGLTAPLVYHGMCNAMVELSAVHYFAG